MLVLDAEVLFPLLVRLTLGLLLAASATAKLLRFQGFLDSLRAYHLLPQLLIRPTAILVVIAETVVAAALLVGLIVEVALAAAALMFTVFSAVVGLTMIRRGGVDCGCLGGFVKLRMGWASVAMNAAFAIAALIGAVLFSGELSGRATIGAVTWFVLWASGASLALGYWLTAYAESVATLIDDAIAREVGE